MEHDKFPYLKLKLYLFSSANFNQRQDQHQMTVKDKRDGSFPGLFTYSSGLTTKINSYGRKINFAKFYKRLDQANQFLKYKCDKEGEETTLYQTIRPRPSS